MKLEFEIFIRTHNVYTRASLISICINSNNQQQVILPAGISEKCEIKCFRLIFKVQAHHEKLLETQTNEKLNAISLSI